MSELDIRPVAGMGAEVHGLDLDAIDEGVAAQLNDFIVHCSTHRSSCRSAIG